MIIGLTGPIAAGKDTVAKYLVEMLGYRVVSLGEIVKEEVERRGLPLKREYFQLVGNELRQKHHAGILAELALKKLNSKNGIINGIRNPFEVEYLRKELGKDFLLIAVDAPRELRFKRILERGRSVDPKTFEEFVKQDEKELGRGEGEKGFGIKRCMEMADVTIVNDSTLEELEKKVREIVKRFILR